MSRHRGPLQRTKVKEETIAPSSVISLAPRQVLYLLTVSGSFHVYSERDSLSRLFVELRTQRNGAPASSSQCLLLLLFNKRGSERRIITQPGQ